MTNIFKGSGGFDVAYTINGNNIYANTYGSGDVAYRIDGSNIYKGSGGYDVAYRIDGNNIYKGSGGYDVAYRIDGNRILKGSGGYDVAYRIGYDDEQVGTSTASTDTTPTGEKSNPLWAFITYPLGNLVLGLFIAIGVNKFSGGWHMNGGYPLVIGIILTAIGVVRFILRFLRKRK